MCVVAYNSAFQRPYFLQLPSLTPEIDKEIEQHVGVKLNLHGSKSQFAAS